MQAMYILWVVLGAIVWIFVALWFLKKTFQGYSPASDVSAEEPKKSK